MTSFIIDLFRRILNNKVNALETPQPCLIIDRQIGNNLQIGIISNSAKQALKFANELYTLTAFDKQSDKLTYQWENIKNADDSITLEFEKLSASTVSYKVISNDLVRQQCDFYYKYFKTIGMEGTKEIDELYQFVRTPANQPTN